MKLGNKNKTALAIFSRYIFVSPSSSLLRWCISQPHFPTWCWSSCSSEEWPFPVPSTASFTLSHQSGRNWTMQRYLTPALQIKPSCVLHCLSLPAPYLQLPLSSSARCGKTQPLRSSSLCRLLGEASSLSPHTISSTITATGKHTKGKPCFWQTHSNCHCRHTVCLIEMSVISVTLCSQQCFFHFKWSWTLYNLKHYAPLCSPSVNA